MSKENINQIPLIDLSNFNPNKVIDFSFNYELLKYVLSALINNQQNFNNELSNLKLDNIKQKKYSIKLASEIIELKLQKASSPEDLDKLNAKKKEINSLSEQYDKDLETYLNQINSQTSKKEIKIYQMKKFETDNKNEVSEKDNNSETSEKINDTEKKDDNIGNKDRKRKESKNKKEETSKEKLDGEYKNIIDDINKKMESLNKDLTNTKSTLQTLQKDLFSFRTNTLGQNKENIEKKIPQMIDEAFNNKISPVQRNLTFELNQIKYNVTGLEKKYEEKINKLNEDTKNLDTTINEKLGADFESIKKGYEKIKNSLSLNSEKLSNAVTPLAFSKARREIEEKIEEEKKALNIAILEVKNATNSLTNQLIDHLNDSRNSDNIAYLMKKTETMNGNITKLLDFKKITEDKDKRKAVVDNSKYVKPETFNEGINNLKKMIENSKKEFTEIRFDIAAIREDELINKASLKDLKSLEDKIFERMEKLKDIIKENFVEKNMFVKNLKYLEFQTKNLIEENKKVEKADNWLLAKKAINPHLCASCDTYLGDLKPVTNSNFVGWNRFPLNESARKIFKVNGGFSKVMNLVNQDISAERSKSNSENVSKERNSSSEDGKLKNKIYNTNKGPREKILIPSKSYSRLDEIDNGKNLPKIFLKNKNRMGENNTTQNKNYNLIKSSYNNIETVKKDEFYSNLKDLDEVPKSYDDNNPKITKIYKRKGYSPEKTDA